MQSTAWDLFTGTFLFSFGSVFFSEKTFFLHVGQSVLEIVDFFIQMLFKKKKKTKKTNERLIGHLDLFCFWQLRHLKAVRCV